MKLIRREITKNTQTFDGRIVDVVAVRPDHGLIFAYFEVDDDAPWTTVDFKFARLDQNYPTKDFEGYKYFDIIDVMSNGMFQPFRTMGNTAYEYHVYVKITREEPKAEKKSDPVPVGAELFGAKTTKMAKTYTTKQQSKINPDILKNFI